MIETHSRFLGTFSASLKRQGIWQATATFGLLVLWQIANAAGFLFSAIRKPARK